MTLVALDGVLVVDKPEDITSHDVVAAVRRRLPRGTRVGHTGTLDPFATGVLPIVVGRATRLAQFLTASRKRYVADIAFGTATDSCDRTGAPVETAAPEAMEALCADTVAAALTTFLGPQAQVPPLHSAKKIDGERAYVLARSGADVQLPAAEVTAHAVELCTWDPSRRIAVVALETSAGFYVRSLARDLGQRVGVPAHLSALRRVASGPFAIDDAHSVPAVVQASAEELSQWRVPLARLLPHLPEVTLDAEQVRAVLQGRPIRMLPSQRADEGEDAGRVRLLDQAGDLVALARPAAAASHELHADIVLR